MKQEKTIPFRAEPRNAWLVAVLASMLLALLGTALFVGASEVTTAQRLGGAMGAMFLAGLIAIAVRVALRPPVVLRIGPEGLDLPIAFRTPLQWQNIRAMVREGPHTGLHGGRDWLVVHPVEGVLPDHRFPGPRRMELWHLRRNGIRIPLHGILGPPEDVLSAIARYRPM